MSFSVTAVFGQHSGSDLLKAGQNVALQAINASPITNSDGTISRDDDGQPYVDINKARARISEQQAGLQERTMRDLQGPISTHGAQDIRENLENLRKLEVGQVCLDIICADEHSDQRRLNTQLSNAMNGLNPTNAGQGAASATLGATLDSKLEPRDETPRARVEIQPNHSGAF
jgi:hypothetical protein